MDCTYKWRLPRSKHGVPRVVGTLEVSVLRLKEISPLTAGSKIKSLIGQMGEAKLVSDLIIPAEVELLYYQNHIQTLPLFWLSLEAVVVQQFQDHQATEMIELWKQWDKWTQ